MDRSSGGPYSLRSMGYTIGCLLRDLIPTVVVRLATDDGEVTFRARWKGSPEGLHRRILFCLRDGRRLWFEDEWGHTRTFSAERVIGAMVDGRTTYRPYPAASSLLAVAGSRPA